MQVVNCFSDAYLQLYLACPDVPLKNGPSLKNNCQGTCTVRKAWRGSSLQYEVFLQAIYHCMVDGFDDTKENSL